jgi:hypothetical protein
MNLKSSILRSIFFVLQRGRFSFFLVLCLLFTLLNISPTEAGNIKNINLTCPPKGPSNFKIGADDEGFKLYISGCRCHTETELRPILDSPKWWLKKYKTFKEAEQTILLDWDSSTIGPIYLKPGEKKTLTIYCIDYEAVRAWVKALYGR